MARKLLYILICVLALACADDRQGDDALGGFNPELLLAERKAKDAEFARGDGPLPAESVPGFTGLSYFEPSEVYVVPAAFTLFDLQEEVVLQTSDSTRPRTMLRYGEFRFTVDGQQCRLTAYKGTGVDAKRHPRHLFIPFSDATSGRETYAAGRYLDLVESSSSSEYVLDFNKAYNPYCAYNHLYVCPLVPVENVLPVAIGSGEKLYSAEQSIE